VVNSNMPEVAPQLPALGVLDQQLTGKPLSLGPTRLVYHKHNRSYYIAYGWARKSIGHYV